MGHVCFLLALLLAVCAEAAAAGRSPSGACEPLQLGPRQERLSLLLHELSSVRSFRLRYWSREDPIVTHEGGSDIELMTKLSRQVNLMVRYAPVRGCPGHWRIHTVWVLPSSKTPTAPISAQRDSAALPETASETVSPKAAMDMYVQAHGLPPSSPPATASRPAR